MSPDDSEFQQIYESLPPGLVVAACTSKSFGMMMSLNEEILTSFCRSLKGAAIRCGSNAMHFWWGYSGKNWKTKGIEHFTSFIEKHNAAGVRLFLINRPTDYSIDQSIALLIREACLAKNVTGIVTTVAEDAGGGKFNKDVLVSKDRKNIHFRVGTAFILLERHRSDDDWYSATVYIGAGDKHYGPLYFVSESPQTPEETQAQPNPESAVDPTKTPDGIEAAAKRFQTAFNEFANSLLTPTGKGTMPKKDFMAYMATVVEFIAAAKAYMETPDASQFRSAKAELQRAIESFEGARIQFEKSVCDGRMNTEMFTTHTDAIPPFINALNQFGEALAWHQCGSSGTRNPE